MDGDGQRTKPNPDYQLLLLDWSGHPLKAALATGNTETATHLSVFVPGTGATVAEFEGDLARVKNSMAEARRIMKAKGEDTSQLVGVLWLGYDAPDEVFDRDRFKEAKSAAQNPVLDHSSDVRKTNPFAWPLRLDEIVARRSAEFFHILLTDGGTRQDALNTTFAREGAEPFARFGEGLRTTAAPDTRIVATAHSYAGAVVGGGAMKTDAFDALIVSGAPGTFADNADQFRLRDGIYVSEAQWLDQDYSRIRKPIDFLKKLGDAGDVVPDIGDLDGRFGADPSDMPGAKVFDNSARTIDSPEGLRRLGSPHGHSSYWDESMSSLHNEAAVISGHTEDVQLR